MLQTKLNEQSKVNEELTKSSHGKIQQLKESLEKNKCSFHKVSQELKSTKNDVLIRDQKISALDDLVCKMKTELTTHESKCKDLEREVQRLKENNSKQEFIIDEGKKKETDLENIVNKLEKDIGTINVEHKSKIKEIEAKHDESVAYIKSGHSTEVKRMQLHFKDKELAMKIKIEALEKEKTSAEENISQLKSELLSNKLKAEEDLFNLKTQHKHEQLHSCKQNEEKISALQVSRDEQHVQINKLLKQIAELQRELNLKVRELAEVNEEKDSVAKESDRKQNDHKAEISRLKMELQSEKKTQENLKDQMSNLESNMKENSRKYKDWIANKEREIESLQEKLQGKETDLKRQREEELRRADLLESAIFTFVHSARSTRPPSPSK